MKEHTIEKFKKQIEHNTEESESYMVKLKSMNKKLHEKILEIDKLYLDISRKDSQLDTFREELQQKDEKINGNLSCRLESVEYFFFTIAF